MSDETTIKTWIVTYPIAGTASCEVEAEDKESAISAGWSVIGDPDNTEITWEALDHIVTGNVFWGESNDIEVEES